MLLVYDITDGMTFQSIRAWMAQILTHADSKVNKVLIGNKCDLEEQRVRKYIENGHKKLFDSLIFSCDN